MARPEITGRKVADAEGWVVAHTIRESDLVLKKGTLIGKAEIAALKAAGIAEIVVVRIEPKTQIKPKRPARTKKRQRARFRNLQPGAYTIPSFCVAHDLSESFYHKLRSLGLGPREMRVERRVLISHEAASDWRKEREEATPRALPPPSPEAA